MAGYNGWSMSNNAVEAYSNGEKPLSKWTKADIFDTIEEQKIKLKCSIDKLRKLPVKILKDICLTYSSWHHTSNHYNKTDFYSLDADRIEKKWECAFLEWSGSRKHPVATEVIEEGTIKGDWFYRKDGSKKKTTANGFRFIKQIQ